MIDEGTKYPDLEADGLGDLKEIRRINGIEVESKIPQIRWGRDYRSWPIEKRLRYAERLASAMNHAADVLQTDRNSLLAKNAALEAKVILLEKMVAGQGATMHHELGLQDAEKQALYKQIVQQTSDLKAARKRIQELERAQRGAFG